MQNTHQCTMKAGGSLLYCKEKCINVIKVDNAEGLACSSCKSFGYCVCKCKTFNKKEKHTVKVKKVHPSH